MGVGAQSGKGRVFTRHGRRADVERPASRLVRRPWSERTGAARVAFQQLKIPQVTYDGMSVPNYENRNPPPRYQPPFHAVDSMIRPDRRNSLSLFAGSRRSSTHHSFTSAAGCGSPKR
jgi:hypothetical protein